MTPRTAGPCPACACPYLILKRRADERPLIVTASYSAKDTHCERVGELLECVGCRKDLALTPVGLLIVGEKFASPTMVTTNMNADKKPERPPQQMMDSDLKFPPRG